MKRVALSFALVWGALACSSAPAPLQSPTVLKTQIVATSIAAAPPAPTIPALPALSPEEAHRVATELVATSKLEEYLIRDEEIARAKAAGLDAPKTLQLLEGMGRDCLASHDREDAHCVGLSVTGDSATNKLVHTLIAYLGEVADPTPLGSPSERLLKRLDVRGVWRAGMAIERILTRRMQASLGRCVAPSQSEIDEAKASLQDFVVIAGVPLGPTVPSKPHVKVAIDPTADVVARVPTSQELDDLGYFYAAIRESGSPVGQSPEDRSQKALTAADPASQKRKELHEAMQLALYDGKLEEHAKLADEYLRSLGFPGPIRVNEEGDQRWGGAGFSYVMREAAQTNEILGRNDVAAELYRRAAPGGGSCGTSTNSIRDDQVAGLVRTTEQASGCRAALAERLYVGTEKEVGPERLFKAGFDLERLYRGALVTANRGSEVDVERALNSAPALLAAGRDRLARLGNEAWSDRVHGIVGYADTAHKKGIERLFAMAEAGLENDRVQAITAIGDMAENIGYEACEKPMRHGWGHGSSGPREALSVMHECEGSLNDAEMKSVITRLGALDASPSSEVRTAVAIALGKTAHPSAKPFLQKMQGDVFDNGGQVCQLKNNGPEICQPNRPVRLAAIEGLEQLANAARNRAEDRKEKAEEQKQEAQEQTAAAVKKR